MKMRFLILIMIGSVYKPLHSQTQHQIGVEFGHNQRFFTDRGAINTQTWFPDYGLAYNFQFNKESWWGMSVKVGGATLFQNRDNFGNRYEYWRSTSQYWYAEIYFDVHVYRHKRNTFSLGVGAPYL